VVSDFDELAALGADKVRGKIVVYNYNFTSYGSGRNYRSTGASRAAALGAVAVLVRSATPLAMQAPHTGAAIRAPIRRPHVRPTRRPTQRTPRAAGSQRQLRTTSAYVATQVRARVRRWESRARQRGRAR